MAIRTCVVPAAGLGTRFLPLTKVLPKEMLPVGDRPAIQWAVEEAAAAGAGRVVLVLSEGKELMAAHFQPAPALEQVLRDRGRAGELEGVTRSSELAEVRTVYQAQPLGLGHAVLMAEPEVGGEPFLCLLPDDISPGPDPVLAQLAQAHRELGTPVLALMRVAPEQISRYGCAAIAESRGRAHRVTAVVEKPRPEEAQSDLAVMGRYVLTPAIFDALRTVAPGAGGEIQLTDGIGALLNDTEVWGVEFEGELLDVGTPEGWLRTNVELARHRHGDRSAGRAATMSLA